jgi:hypothetical protein
MKNRCRRSLIIARDFPTLSVQHDPASRLVVVTSAADSGLPADADPFGAEVCHAVRGDIADLRDHFDTIVRTLETAPAAAQE